MSTTYPTQDAAIAAVLAESAPGDQVVIPALSCGSHAATDNESAEQLCTCEPTTEPPWAELDAGIRETVRVLWAAGFTPTDSGDGSKAATMECAVETAHVFMRCDPAHLIAEADRLAALVSAWPRTGDYNGEVVEASYAPGDGIGVLMLFGVVAP